MLCAACVVAAAMLFAARTEPHHRFQGQLNNGFVSVSAAWKSGADTLRPPRQAPQKATCRPIDCETPLAVIFREAQTLVLYEASGSLVATYPCSTGVYYPRPGRYRLIGRRRSSSSPWDGSRFEYFTVFAKSHRGTAIGFHSVPVDRAGSPVAPLGEANSHGCVRVELDVARMLYDWIDSDTVIYVTM